MHQGGTLRFGNGPVNSVLDANCKAHDLDNLYVTDTDHRCQCAARR
ncbi:GMC oxidoreductase [Lichenicoccus sp.]